MKSFVTSNSQKSVDKNPYFGGPKKEGGHQLFFQPKLTIGLTDDVYEKEADAVADQVMRMGDGKSTLVQRKISPVRIQRMCSACEEEKVQRKEGKGTDTTNEAPSIVSEALQSTSTPLDTNTRSLMEERIGYDFSAVKIHTGSLATKSAQAINALAYTSGNSIVFNAGQYAPETPSGKRLLAHELTHVVQQNVTVHSKRVQRTTDPYYESLAGLDRGFARQSLTQDAIMGKKYFAVCGPYNLVFSFPKAYTGTYPYQLNGKSIEQKGIYVKIEISYSETQPSGNCTKMRIIQVIQNVTKSSQGNMQATDPDDPTRQARSGWGDPNAASRGWRIDTVNNTQDPFYSGLTHASKEGSAASPAVLWDSPSYEIAETNTGKEFRTCAVCEDASGKQWVAGCVSWGFYTDSAGSVAFKPPEPHTNCGSLQQVEDASLRWDAIQGNTATGITF